MALFLMLFGDWQFATEPETQVPDAPVNVDFEVRPRQIGNPGQDFEIIGHASTLLSRYSAQVARSSYAAQAFIPPDFASLVVHRRSEQLPLWRFEVLPTRAVSDADITARLDEIYSREPSNVEEELERAATESLRTGEW